MSTTQPNKATLKPVGETKLWAIYRDNGDICSATICWTKARAQEQLRRGGYTKEYRIARVSIREIKATPKKKKALRP